MKRAILCLLAITCIFTLFAQQPEWVWAKQLDYPADWKTALDTEGNIYMTGEFDSTAVFGTTTLTSAGKSDIFIAKMSKEGQWLWAIQAGGAGNDVGRTIALDKSGNIYLSGWFHNAVNFGKTTLNSSEDGDMFIGKLDSSGNWLWATQTGANGNVGAGYLAVDELGNIIISGQFYGKAAFYDTTLNSISTNFISKLDNQGKRLWSKTFDAKTSIPYAIALDKKGNIYFTGNFSGMITICDSVLASGGLNDSFVGKFNTNGQLVWLSRTVARYGTTTWSIATDSAGNSYITGTGDGAIDFGKHELKCGIVNIFVAKLDSLGNWEWAKKAGDGKSFNFSMSVDVDNAGKPYITGCFMGKIKFGSHKLIAKEQNNIFTAGLDKHGNWLWALNASGPKYSEGHTISLDNDGNAIIAGYYSGDVDFGSIKLSDNGSNNFIAKLKIK